MISSNIPPSLQSITSQKYFLKITIKFSEDFILDTIALFDTGADLNCVKDNIIPRKLQQPSNQTLLAANNQQLPIRYKTEATIINQNVEIKTVLVLLSDIQHTVILGTPFIHTITPYTVHFDHISSNSFSSKLTFPFVEKPRTRTLDLLNAQNTFTNEIDSIIKEKEVHLSHLNHSISNQRIEEQLLQNTIKSKIISFQKQVEDDLCSDLPNAFWDRKQHIVDLPYEKISLIKISQPNPDQFK